MRTHLKLKLILLAFLTAAGVAGYFVYTYSYIEVMLPNNQSGTYTLLKQGDNQEPKEMKLAGTSKQLVARGNYEVLVKSNNQSSFSVVSAKGLLATTQVNTKLASENERTFIGDNPFPCAYQTDNALLSMPCGDTINNLVVHVPASESTATYTTKATNPITGFVQGVAATPNGYIALIKAPRQSEEEGAPHTLYTVDSQGQASNGTAVEGLDENKTYGLRAYKEGFVIYGLEDRTLLFFNSINTAGQPLSIEPPKDQAMSFYSLEILDEKIAATYTNSKQLVAEGFQDTTLEDTPVGRPEQKNAKSEVVFFDGSKSSRFVFNEFAQKALPCGDNRVCVLKDQRLRVYGTANGKLELLNQIDRALNVIQDADRLLIERPNEVIAYDIQKQQGYVSYTLGNYRSCGTLESRSGYLLCIADNKRQRVLQISQLPLSETPIDQKVYELTTMPEISDLSVYGSFIHVSPELGAREYNPQVSGYTFNPATKARVNAAIQQRADQLGIDRKKYTIVNPLQ